MTRKKTYAFLDEREADSTLIVTGTPIQPDIVRDVDPETWISHSTRFKSSRHKRASRSTPSLSGRRAPSPGNPPPVSLMLWRRYLLYLVPDEQASQLYVTGPNAGICKAADGTQTEGSSGESTLLTHADLDPADTLPTTIEIPA